jgi:hypothetical protein
MKLALDIGSAIFAFGAALFWFLSATVALPKNYPLGLQSVLIRVLGEALSEQSRLSAVAAVSAGLAAVCQAVSLFV